ncbi:hypothetical protein [Streptomyces misionensis]|uniref:hypothetical protein n=1 Tax=Streptomyces misionensis TaxID=67331 RepID=UPI003687AD70
MSPDLVPPGPVRSAAELNAQIRALWSHPAVPLTREQRAEYERLCAELARLQREAEAAAAPSPMLPAA